MKYIAQMALWLYRTSFRVRCKFFSVLITGAFSSFGKKSVLALPIRLSGENRIAIGDGVSVGANSWLQALQDGDNTSVAISIGNGSSIAGLCVISAVRKVVLEDQVLLARNVYISDHMHRYTHIGVSILAQGLDRIRPVIIQRGAWIGENVVVCPGVTVGTGSVVGANSVVTEDVPEYSVAVGAPARVVKTIRRQEVHVHD
jgi:serine acetyltransferase